MKYEMIAKSEVLIDSLVTSLNNDIDEYNTIIDILGDDKSLIDVVDSSIDIEIMKAKKNSAVTFRNMVLKTSLELDDVDNETILTSDEKKIFLKLVVVAMWFLRLFKMVKSIFSSPKKSTLK